MSDLFQNMKSDIKDSEKTHNDDCFYILSETADTITVYDNFFSKISKEYTITDTDSINKQWIRDKIIVTKSANALDIKIDTDKIAEFLNSVDKYLLMTLNDIVFCADTDKDYDELADINDEWNDRLQVSNLPDENLIGIMWYEFNTVCINMAAVIETINDMLKDGQIYDWERHDAINRGIGETLIHELRHLAQVNPFIPEKILRTLDNNDEIDAERYCIIVCEEKLPYLLQSENDDKI